MRRGAPNRDSARTREILFALHTQGSTGEAAWEDAEKSVYPARAGRSHSCSTPDSTGRM